jgi:uncharacterized repeat protein (TIGR02543 family)
MAHPANTDPDAGWYSTLYYGGMDLKWEPAGNGWTNFPGGEFRYWPYPCLQIGTGEFRGSTRKVPILELGNYAASAVYQDIATVPGKIYEWSFRHNGVSYVNGTVALVIGKAINEEAEYTTGSNRWERNRAGNRMQVAVQGYDPGRGVLGFPEIGYKYEYNGYVEGDFRYGASENSFFDDVVTALATQKGVAIPSIPVGAYTVPYNGSVYYVYVAYAANGSDIDNSGTYTVPEGQGTTVFGFAAVSPRGSAQGNGLSRIAFASGSDIEVSDKISYFGETKISTETKAGFAYTLAEVRGSSVSSIPGLNAFYDADSDGAGLVSVSPQVDLGDGNWYTQYGGSTPFEDTGTITFTNLVPGKTYRVIGIPIGSISVGLGTNLSAADVLDDGYYQDVPLSGATAVDPSKPDELHSFQISYYDIGAPTKALIELQNTNINVEYALLNETSPDVPNTASPEFGWTSGTGDDLLFDGLSPGAAYYLLARPLGYSEINYVTAPRLKIVIPPYGSGAGLDLLASQVTRTDTDGETISISGSDADYTYAIYVPEDGVILDIQPGDGGTLSFTGLDKTTTYQVVQRYTADGSFLQGVRVYPYPKHLSASNELFVNYPAGTVGTVDGTGSVPAALEYNITSASLTDADAFAPGTGSSPITLSDASGLNGEAGALKYRVAAASGYGGALVQPANSLDFTAVPAAPAVTTDYTIDYAAETVAISNTGLTYEQFDAGGNTKLRDIAGNTTYAFADLGWTESREVFNLHVKADQSAERFASAMTEVALEGRPAAPELDISLDTGTNKLTIGGLQVGNTYEYKQATTASWGGASTVPGADGFVLVDYIAGSSAEYQVRIAATSALPASYISTISSPLYIAPINFGSSAYGADVTPSPLTINNISITTLHINEIRLTGADAGSFSIDTDSGDTTVVAGDVNASYKIGTNGTLNARPAPYTATVEVEYFMDGSKTGDVAVTSTNVSLTVTKADWVFSPEAWTPPTSVTSNSATVDYTSYGGAPAGAVLSWSTGSGYTPDGSATAASGTKTLDSLAQATTYTITVQALGDDNHNASGIKTVGTVYTKYETPTVEDIIYVDYVNEQLRFVDGVTPGNYTVRAGSDTGTILANGAVLSDLANAGDFSLMVSRNGSGSYPASDYSGALSVTGKAPAPSPITATKAASSSDTGSIAVAGAFQYRPHNTANQTAGWMDAANSVSVMPGSWDVRTASLSPATVFASKLDTVTVGVKDNQTLTITPPGTLTYGDAPVQLASTGGSANITATYAAVTANNAVATVSADGLLTINGAGIINVRASKAGNADYNAGTSPITPIIISPRDIDNSAVTLSPALSASYPYTGSAINPAVTAVLDASATITANDYTISYGAPPVNTTVAAGGTVTLTGKNNYTGAKIFHFAITPAGQGAVTVTTDNATPFTYGDGPVTLTASGGSGTGGFEYQLAANTDPGGNAGTIAGNQLTITGAGTIKVQARRAADVNYAVSAWSDVKTFTVGSRPINVDVDVKDKPYDGTTAAAASAELHAADIVTGDAGLLTLVSSAVSFTFDTAAVGSGKTVTRSGDYSLSGVKAGSYTLTQPAATFTAAITAGFTPMKDTHYTIEPEAEWSKSNFVVRAASGYAVSKTNTAGGAGEDAWTETVTWTDETDNGSAVFYVKRTGGAVIGSPGIAQGEISGAGNETYKIDRTAPNAAEIDYKGKGLKGFLNTITFGRFFKVADGDPVTVVIAGYDAAGTVQSGVDANGAEYFVTTTAYTTEAAQKVVADGTLVSWTQQNGNPLSVLYSSAGKYHIFARVTDRAGNSTIFYDSAVIFLESAAVTGDIPYTRLEKANKDVTVTLNNNTIKAVRQTSPAAVTLTLGTDYTVAGGTITLKKEYLETLKAVAPGPDYEFAVDYYPRGETGAAYAGDGAYSDTPTATTFTVTVAKKNQAPLTVVPPAPPVTYGDTGRTLTYSGGSGDGALTYTVVSGPASVISGTGVLTITGSGTVRVKVARAANDDYHAAESAEVDFTVGKAEITGFTNPSSVTAGKATEFTPSQEAAYGDDTKAAASLLAQYPMVLATYAGGTVCVDVDHWVYTGEASYGTHAYDITEQGEYYFEAVLDALPANIANTAGLTATATVVVNDVLHGIMLGESGTYSIGTAAYGYTAANYDHFVNIHNFGTQATGSLKATITGSNPERFVLTPEDGVVSSIAIGGDSATDLKVTPASGLTVGTHTVKLTVADNDDGNTDLKAKSYDVRFVVTPAEITGFDAVGPLPAGSVGGSGPTAPYADAAAVIAALPATVTANYAGGAVPAAVSVTWTASGAAYDAAVAGTYTFAGTPDAIPANFANTGGHTATATVVLLPKDAAAPAIGTQPADGTYFTDQSPASALSVTLSDPGNGTLSYQWYSNTTNSNSGGTPISGAVSAFYTPPITAAGTTCYYVEITASVPGAATPSAAVKSDPAQIIVTVRPAPVLTAGSAVRDSATAATIAFTTDQPGVAYYLEAASAPGAAVVVAANQPLGNVSGSVTGKSVTLTGEGEKHIYVVVAGTTTDPNKYSNVLDITAAKFDNTAPQILSVTPNGTAAGISGTITVTFSEPMDMNAGTITLTGGANTIGTTAWTDSETYTAGYGDLDYFTEYTLVFGGFRDAADNALSTAAGAHKFTTVRPGDAVAPAITVQPAPSTDYWSTDTAAAPLTVTASNGANPGTLSYQWYYNTTDSNDPLAGGAVLVAGADSASHTPEITTLASERYYFCVVTNTVTNAANPTAAAISATARVKVTVPRYTVKFNIGSSVDAGSVTPGNITADINTSVTLPDDKAAPGFSRRDYTFGGWSLTGGMADYPVGSLTFITSVPGDVNLQAFWIENVVLIFDSEGGTAVGPVHLNGEATYGAVPGWPISDPTKAGFAFDAWYIEEVDDLTVANATLVTGSDDIAATVSAATGGGTATENITLYAHWSPLDTSAFDKLIAAIEADFGLGAIDIHPENYPAGEAEAFMAAVANAKAAAAAATSQDAVDDIVAALRTAYANLEHDHPVLYHSHEVSKGGVNRVTAYGQTIKIEFKGHIGDVSGFTVNGSANYTVTAGTGQPPSAVESWDIHEGAAGGPVIGSITKGSALVTLKPAFTDRFGNGTHTIEALFREGSKSGSGSADIVVSRSRGNSYANPGEDPGAGEPVLPHTGDNMNLILWLAIAAMIAMLVAVWLHRKAKGKD